MATPEGLHSREGSLSHLSRPAPQCREALPQWQKPRGNLGPKVQTLTSHTHDPYKCTPEVATTVGNGQESKSSHICRVTERANRSHRAAQTTLGSKAKQQSKAVGPKQSQAASSAGREKICQL